MGKLNRLKTQIAPSQNPAKTPLLHMMGTVNTKERKEDRLSAQD